MTEAELNALAEQGDDTHAMNAGCTDYACYCHAKVPVLVAEIRRLRAALKRIAEYDPATSPLYRHAEFDAVVGMAAEALGGKS